ncbi:uncharacterized protein LOC108628426 isoform X1 [Ceratina calcarata]|uniref:Uncharacterized protein LOC108628426 isoform X1 n=1 Tax=Ceratina calcarata TaxID=156304 RepID=A0AAJ7S6P0_9HYME|nr:uncharacterized protein LOC108628426 isoform X1 [Ceratina calcarata]
MIARRCSTLTIAVCLILSVKFGAKAERWSRQVSNSEWIPLANPRATQTHIEQTASGNTQLPQLPQINLPPALQQQYQDQLLQLQKTQENIQKLLLLQQQLKAQQQLLQSQTFVPSGFSNAEEDKELHQVGELGGSRIADLATEDLVPPLPASEALPPVFPAQNFLPQRPPRPPQPKPEDFANLPGQEFKAGQLLQHGNVGQIDEHQRPGAKQLKESQIPVVSQDGDDGEEEVQLVYVPAETLAQRGHPKRGRGRKYPHRQQQIQQSQYHENQGIDLHEQDAFARQILQQMQMEREENAQFLKEERIKEFARLNEEQRALERKNRLQQEALQREQELQRQREAEKKRKELEKLEELAKQRELERIREAREKQRLEELERRRLAEIRAKEEKRKAEEARQREAERLASLERQKELELQALEKQRENEARLTGPDNQVQAQALPLIREHQQFHRQHLTETPKQKKVRGRQRQRQNQYQDQQNYRETTTTPSPNQPPLSVYMGSSSSRTPNVKVSDVLKILKDAKTIAVLDTVGPDTPQVFVGPTSLDPPSGYAKFDLPYLSSIDHNRVERKVDKLPFFVAPLSFDPPAGYSKIPFPAPHIGSVVVNTLDNDPKDSDYPNPSPTPLIEPNSYLDGLESGSDSTTPSYEPQTTVSYAPESPSTQKYEQSYSVTPSGYAGARFRFKQYYNDNKPASVVSTSYYEDQRPATRKQKFYDDNFPRTTEIPIQNSKDVSQKFEDVAYVTTANYKEETIRPHDSFNQELTQQRESQRYDTGSQYGTAGYEGEITVTDVNDVRAPVGPTQYSLPAELPAISPQLPGLVNSLLDKNDAKQQISTTTPTTTTTTTTASTTTTQKTPTTTYRPRSRQRIRTSSQRPRTTTQAPSTRANVDRSRRPYNRSRSRFTTTTEEYRESIYDPTKSKIPETTLKYNAEHRRSSSRTNKYRSRDKTSQSEQVHGQQNTQAQQYETGSQVDNSPGFVQPSSPESSSLRQPEHLSSYAPENYPSTTVSTTESYPTLRDVTVNHGTALVSEDYSRSQNYPQTVQEYRPTYHDQSTVEQVGLDKSPVNGFNYQAQSGELDQGLQRPKDYQLDGKVENGEFELPTTIDPKFRTTEDQRYSTMYDANAPQLQPEYTLTGQDNLHRMESQKIQSGAEQPIFIPLPEKQEEFELPATTETPLSDITPETTPTSTTPLIIRQRVRGRLGGPRVHHESSVQTRNRGSQDEYVRFNAVNQDSTRTSPSRQRVRSRPRTQSHSSQVQTDGNDYIKFHPVQQQRQATTTTTTTTTASPPEEDADYGFIRAPNFRPSQQDNRYPAPVTYRPQPPELPLQSLLPSDETAVESSVSQTQLLKNRQKYQPAPNRRLPSRLPATAPETTTTTERIPVATVYPDDSVYVKPKTQTDSKQTRIRSRVRRPSRKRVSTSTTESAVDAHNELPLDENYPRIRPQQTTEQQQQLQQQQALYEDNYESTGLNGEGTRNQGHQIYETSSQNYPSEFVLNFGNYPAPIQRDEYDEAPLASDSSRKYSQSFKSEEDHSTTADIYGAESQWSTKLTRTSFQPSFAVNRVDGVKEQKWHQEENNAPEIITAAPEVSSVTLLVSSDNKANGTGNEDEDEMLMGTTIFGRKTTVQDHTERMNANSATTDVPLAKNRNGSDLDIVRESWLMDRENTEQNIDLKKSDGVQIAKKSGRRRRVRVRVRPAVDDFVTAESQHFNSALNGLFQDQYKYNPASESKQPVVSSENSVLQSFLTEILKNDEPVKTTTTEAPETTWTMPPAVTTPMTVPDDVPETTEIETTVTPTTEKLEESTTGFPFLDFFSKLTKPEDVAKANENENKDQEMKEEKIDSWESTKKWNQNTLNFGSISEKYIIKDKKLNNDSKAVKQSDKESKTEENEMETRNETKPEFGRNEEDHAHPKNHRAKWSEVRYPSAFDSPAARFESVKTNKKSSRTSIPGLVTKSEGDTSVKSLSDYVQAIFDTMKSAEEEDTTTGNTESPELTTINPGTELPVHDSTEVEKSSVTEIRTTTETVLEETRTTANDKEATQTTESSTNIDLETATTLGATSDTATSPSAENSATEPPATFKPDGNASINSTDSMLGKVLRTSTTTKVSHMTEICYRGRCVMTRPNRDDQSR